MIYIYTYTCEHVHVYKEVQSWSIRKGTNKCESAQHRSIYQHIRDMILDICIFVSIWYVCMQRGSNCEHSQGHRIMWVRTTRSHSHKYPKYEICKFVSISMYTKRFKLWALARAQTYVSSHNTESYTKVPVIWNMYFCEYTYVYKGSRCEHSLQSVHWQGQRHMWFGTTWVYIQKYLSYDMIYAYLWIYVCIQRGSKCVGSRGQRHMWVCTTSVHIQE